MEETRQQSPNGVAVLVENHRRFLSFLKGRIANPSDAEDILQAAFVKGIKKADSIRDGESVVAWFYRLLRNAMVDYYRALVRGGGGSRQRKLGYPVIETPTLMIWGEEDPALGIELTRATGDFVKDLTLRTLPGVSHWVQQEAPETVNGMLEAWLTGEPVPEARETESA